MLTKNNQAVQEKFEVSAQDWSSKFQLRISKFSKFPFPIRGAETRKGETDFLGLFTK